MVVGVSEGFTKDLELVGIGFRTAMKGNVLVLNVGYYHQVEMPVKEGLEVTCPTATTIEVAGIDITRSWWRILQQDIGAIE